MHTARKARQMCSNSVKTHYNHIKILHCLYTQTFLMIFTYTYHNFITYYIRLSSAPVFAILQPLQLSTQVESQDILYVESEELNEIFPYLQSMLGRIIMVDDWDMVEIYLIWECTGGHRRSFSNRGRWFQQARGSSNT